MVASQGLHMIVAMYRKRSSGRMSARAWGHPVRAGRRGNQFSATTDSAGAEERRRRSIGLAGRIAHLGAGGATVGWAASFLCRTTPRRRCPHRLDILHVEPVASTQGLKDKGRP